MTRPRDAASARQEAMDFGPEQEKPQEPTYVKPTNPVIPVPAVSNPSKLQEAIEKARAIKAAKEEKLREARERREASLIDSEPPRDELEDLANAMIEAATNSQEAKEVAKVLASSLAERQEMMRNVHQVLGVIGPEIRDYGENIEDKLRALIAGNGGMREAIRLICEAAGTVRVSKPVIVEASTGVKKLTFRHVDVGDEEPEQDPIVGLEYLLPAAIRAAARFRRLIAEHDTATKAKADAEFQLVSLQESDKRLSAENRTLKERNAALEAAAQEIRPNAPGTPSGYYLKTETGLWVAKYEGKHSCFVNRWHLVTNPSEAHSFEFKQDASELLARLQFARLHRIGRQHRETLRVVTVRYEDHT